MVPLLAENYKNKKVLKELGYSGLKELIIRALNVNSFVLNLYFFSFISLLSLFQTLLFVGG